MREQERPLGMSICGSSWFFLYHQTFLFFIQQTDLHLHLFLFAQDRDSVVARKGVERARQFPSSSSSTGGGGGGSCCETAKAEGDGPGRRHGT